MRSDLYNDKVDGPPKGVPLAIDLHEHLIQMQSPLQQGSRLLAAFLANLGCRRRAAPVPPQTNGLMANVNAALVKQVLDISKRKREANVHHDCQTKDFRAGSKVPDWTAFGRYLPLWGGSERLKSICLIGPLREGLLMRWSILAIQSLTPTEN